VLGHLDNQMDLPVVVIDVQGVVDVRQVAVLEPDVDDGTDDLH